MSTETEQQNILQDADADAQQNITSAPDQPENEAQNEPTNPPQKEEQITDVTNQENNEERTDIISNQPKTAEITEQTNADTDEEKNEERTDTIPDPQINEPKTEERTDTVITEPQNESIKAETEEKKQSSPSPQPITPAQTEERTDTVITEPQNEPTKPQITSQTEEQKQCSPSPQPIPTAQTDYKIEEVELKFAEPNREIVRPFLPKLKTLDSAMYKLFPKPSAIQKDTVHQIWIQGEEHLKQARPHFFQNFTHYKKLQNGKTFLWSEEMIESLIVHEYPRLLTLYHSYSHFIMRVDLAKYIILHMYGGFYVDMDSECRDSFEGLAKMSHGGDQVIVCKVTDDYRTRLYSKKFINNHFLYIPRRHHPFMDVMLDEAPICAKRKPLEPMILYILRAVGPGFLMHCLKVYKKRLNRTRKGKLTSKKEKLFYKKLTTEEIVTVVDSVVLNRYFFHESKNTWLEDSWMDRKDNNDYLLVLGAVSVFLGSATFLVGPYVGLYK